MWTVVYIAPNQVMADMIKEYLEKEGFLVMLRSMGVPHLGASAQHEILVPEAEAEEIQELLQELLGNGS